MTLLYKLKLDLSVLGKTEQRSLLLVVMFFLFHFELHWVGFFSLSLAAQQVALLWGAWPVGACTNNCHDGMLSTLKLDCFGLQISFSLFLEGGGRGVFILWQAIVNCTQVWCFIMVSCRARFCSRMWLHHQVITSLVIGILSCHFRYANMFKGVASDEGSMKFLWCVCFTLCRWVHEHFKDQKVLLQEEELQEAYSSQHVV